MRWEQVSEFKYLGSVLDKSGTDEAVSYEGAIRSLVNGRGFQLECARVL